MILDLVFPAKCPLCGATGRAPCNLCWLALEPAPPGQVLALLSYEGNGARLIRDLKYGDARRAVERLADGMALLVRPGSADVVTWAPTLPQRRRRRGYDQAELLSRAVAKRLGLPCRRYLTRQPGLAQTGRLRVERLAHGPVFTPWPLARVGPARAVLVDDVVTTGATLLSAAQCLRSMGIAGVQPLAAAATPVSSRTRAMASVPSL